MQSQGTISFTANRRQVTLDVRTILYIYMNENVAEVHVSGGTVYKTRTTLETFESILGDGFLKVHRSCLVAVTAIHDITDKINLNNGEALNYVVRRKKQLNAQLLQKRSCILETLDCQPLTQARQEDMARYASFDALPIAFADIEMVVDEGQNAVDWIFRYGNEALARLEKLPLNRLLGSRFSDLFPNRDPKWLRSYERAALYGETLEVIDYSPEIDTYLDIICFPTTSGRCGCILLNIAEMRIAQNADDGQNARLRYLSKLLEQIG